LPVGELRSYYNKVPNAAHLTKAHSELSGLASEIQPKKTSSARNNSSEETESEETASSMGSGGVRPELLETLLGNGIKSVHGTWEEILPSTAYSASSGEVPSKLLTTSARNGSFEETEYKQSASSPCSVGVPPCSVGVPTEPLETIMGNGIESVHETSQEMLPSTPCSTSSLAVQTELFTVNTSVRNGMASVPRTSEDDLWIFATQLLTEGVMNIRPSAVFLLAGILNFSLLSYVYTHLEAPPLHAKVSTITRCGLSTGIGLLWGVHPQVVIAAALLGVIYAPRHIPFSLVLFGGVVGVRQAQLE